MGFVFGLGGAGSGVGTVGVGTVAGGAGVSSARADAGRSRPNISPAAIARMLETIGEGAKRDTCAILGSGRDDLGGP